MPFGATVEFLLSVLLMFARSTGVLSSGNKDTIVAEYCSCSCEDTS